MFNAAAAQAAHDADSNTTKRKMSHGPHAQVYARRLLPLQFFGRSTVTQPKRPMTGLCLLLKIPPVASSKLCKISVYIHFHV